MRLWDTYNWRFWLMILTDSTKHTYEQYFSHTAMVLFILKNSTKRGKGIAIRTAWNTYTISFKWFHIKRGCGWIIMSECSLWNQFFLMGSACSISISVSRGSHSYSYINIIIFFGNPHIDGRSSLFDMSRDYLCPCSNLLSLISQTSIK